MNQGIRVAFYSFFAIFCYSNCTHNLGKKTERATSNSSQIDTIKGYFFYEVNVPLMCYARFDQIEQSNNLIFFDSLINKKNIEKLYKDHSVFIYQFQPIMEPYMKVNKVGIPQNKETIGNFHREIFYFTHAEDTLYNKTLYYDQIKNLVIQKSICRVCGGWFRGFTTTSAKHY